ncbi:hypothetical protein R5R35_009209 [Gryllus longicercus]|uniref:Protein kinase domain-containing protein n=2 Tax=Gryllus TaxID=6998 RepID=A0AAN9YZU4_9ORTH
MYKSDTYKKKGDGPLPIKWMALESIRDRIFSTQSDVWSFGVVMWELFSLGATPYPGMQPSEEFYNKLLSGYRMEHPPYAPRTVYDLMSACWETDPRRRPTFETLASEIGELLDNSTRERFERLIAYEQQKGGVGGECDYLAMLGSPDYGALTSPEEHVYVNTPQAMEGSRPMAPEPNTSTNPDPQPSTDYLNMSRPSTPGTSQVSFC